MNIWQKAIAPHRENPDEVRRVRLLNIILIGFGIAIFLVIVIILSVFAAGLADDYDIDSELLYLCFFALIGIGLLYALGRYISGRLASIILLFFFTFMLFVGDDPIESIGGRSSSFFILPILMASMLIRPSASFIVMGIILAIQSVIGVRMGLLPNFLIGAGYFMTALISWLSAHTLEQAIIELRKINLDLDQRVAERTRTLNEILLREQSESSRNRAILNSIADNVLVFNPEGHLALANPMVSKLTGIPLDQAIGKTLRELMGEHVPLTQQESVEKLLLSTETSVPVQVQWGNQIFSVSCARVMFENEQFMGVVAVFHDVTPEVEVSRMKSAFVAMVSHELRTPLSAVMGLIEILEQQIYGALNEKQNDIITRLMINTQKLTQLVEDLLDHAKIEAGTLKVQIAPFSPRELLYNVTDALTEMARHKNLTLLREIDPRLPVALMGDTRRLGQVLSNLVTNAIKYTDSGQVHVRFQRLERNLWRMQVQDTGVGITPEAQNAVFEAFWQADNSIARRQGGVGLGLSIVKRLVKLMNGEIFLESEVGVGSTFSVVLPMENPAEIEVIKTAL